jgi:hypothetical protein
VLQVATSQGRRFELFGRTIRGWAVRGWAVRGWAVRDWTVEDEQCQRIGGGYRAVKLRFLLFL